MQRESKVLLMNFAPSGGMPLIKFWTGKSGCIERTAENKGIFAITPEDREAENEGEKGTGKDELEGMDVSLNYPTRHRWAITFNLNIS